MPEPRVSGDRRPVEPAMSGGKRRSRRVGWKQCGKRVDSPRRIELPRKGDDQMATERLKFRCYRCNQLLAVAPSKAGTVVSCPKCQADLLIPGGEPRARGDGENRAKAEVEARTGVETEAPARAEAEPRARAEAAAILGSSQVPPKPAPVPLFMGDDRGRDPTRSRRPATRGPASRGRVFREPDPPATAGHDRRSGSLAGARIPHTRRSHPSRSRLRLPSSLPRRPRASSGRPHRSLCLPETADRVPRPSERPSRPDEVSSIGPQIEIEPPSILPPGTEIRRVSEVVLPASVVLAWSLFVLAGIALAFVAGLMMGHFLWKTP